MAVQLIPIDQVVSNPWQTRTAEDPEHIQALADDIAARGLLQTPIGRQVCLDNADTAVTQLAFGHSRLAAWKIAKPGEPFPVDVRELTDRELAEYAIVENAKRAELSAIEKAHAMRRYIDEFKATQVEAGKLFGIGQAAVSNLLRMLQLPKPVQQLVQEGKLAERNARALLVLERLQPEQTTQIAEKAISAENPEYAIDDEIEDLLRKKGKLLEHIPWSLKWPEAPLALDHPSNGLKEIVACIGCPHFFRRHEDGYRNELCARAECYNAKMQLSLQHELERVSKKTGIPIAAEGEKVTVIAGSGYIPFGLKERLKKLAAAKLPELRVVARDDNHFTYERKEITGSDWVNLATTNKAVTDRFLNGDAEERKEIQKKAVKAEGKVESEKEKAKRIEAEKREESARREERSALNKQKWDVLWLVDHAAQIVAEQLQVSGGFLALAQDLVNGGRFSIGSEELRNRQNELEDEIDQAKGKDVEPKRRLHIARQILAPQATDYQGHYRPLSDVREEIATIVSGEGLDDDDIEFEDVMLALKLPAGWDKIPIHRTAFNCWVCGKFAPGEKITGRDRSEGWIDGPEFSGPGHAGAPKELYPGEGVFCCFDHMREYKPAGATAAKSTKAKPAKKAKRQ